MQQPNPDSNFLQDNFQHDLIKFITTHPYYINHEGTQKTYNYDQTTKYTIADPDGAYEELTITLNLIP